MTETPNTFPPLDFREQDILEDLRLIRDELTLLKQDRSTYIKSVDIESLYDKTIQQVQLLNHVRLTKLKKHNQVDRVLDSCFQLLSLFFMTIGRNNDAPAAYALTSTIKRLLDHLSEAGVFSNKDLSHISMTLDKLGEVVKNAHTAHSEELVTLLTSRLEFCQKSLISLSEYQAEIDDNLHKIHEKLISILRSISSASTRTRFSAHEVENLKSQALIISKQRVEGNFVSANGEVLKGSEKMVKLLEKCIIWSEIVLDREGKMPDPFKSTYQKLIEIRNKLARLSLTQAWSLREADLYDYQRELDRIDESRVNGNFLDTDGNSADLYVQRILLYLIRRSYGYIYYLMVDSKPVSEGLLPVYNQLQTLKRCLVEVTVSGGVDSMRELYPYSMKLHSIDNMRTNGKFLVENDVPEGQGNVIDLLEQCYELSHQLQVAAEEEEED